MLKHPLVFIFNILESQHAVFRTSLFDHLKMIFAQDQQECIFVPIRNFSNSMLNKRIESIDKKLKEIGPAHVIAVSISGLDCRIALSHCKTPMQSLFTISSPHHGSELANWASSPGKDFSILDPLTRYLGVPTEAFQEIRPEKIRKLNKSLSKTDTPIFSTSSWKLQKSLSDLVRTSGSLLQGEENTIINWNDGVFYTREMKWENHLLSFDGDHTEILGSNLKVNCAPLYRLALDNARRLELHREGKII